MGVHSVEYDRKAKMAFHRNRITENVERPLSLQMHVRPKGWPSLIEWPYFTEGEIFWWETGRRLRRHYPSEWWLAKTFRTRLTATGVPQVAWMLQSRSVSIRQLQEPQITKPGGCLLAELMSRSFEGGRGRKDVFHWKTVSFAERVPFSEWPKLTIIVERLRPHLTAAPYAERPSVSPAVVL